MPPTSDDAYPHGVSGNRAQNVLYLIRDAWVIIGLALLFGLIAEAAYRSTRVVFQHATQRRMAGLGRPGHPYDRESWFIPWAIARNRVLSDATRYDPYRGWRVSPASYPGLTVDSAGQRLTVQAVPDPGRRRLVFLLGGSTMWGYTSRDSFTIPSLVAKRLRSRGFADVLIVNLAQAGYNAAQGAASLMAELRRGNVPAVVVSLDGVNDIDIVVSGDSAGDILNQTLAERRFARKSVTEDVLGHSQLLSKLLSATSGSRPIVVPSSALCGAIALNYREVVHQVSALRREYGFAAFMLWQPTLAQTRKRRTSYEEALAHDAAVLETATSQCGTVVDLLMRTQTGQIYFPLHDLFDAERETVFIDEYGHVTERANDVIASRITDLIAPVLAQH